MIAARSTSPSVQSKLIRWQGLLQTRAGMLCFGKDLMGIVLVNVLGCGESIRWRSLLPRSVGMVGMSQKVSECMGSSKHIGIILFRDGAGGNGFGHRAFQLGESIRLR